MDRPEDVAVVGHELGHSRAPVLRPRFLLGSPIGHDEEERNAQRTASTLLNRSTTPTPASTASGAAGGPMGSSVLRKTEGAAEPVFGKVGPPVRGSVVSRTAGVVSRTAGVVSRLPAISGAGSVSGRTPPETPGAVQRRFTATDRYLPGLVDSLPVTAVSGLLDAARMATTGAATTRAASAADAVPSNLSGLTSAAGVPATSVSGWANLAGAVGLPGSGLPFDLGAIGGATIPGVSAAADLAGSTDAAAGAAAAGGSAGGGPAPGVAGIGPASGVPGPQSALPADFDRLLEALEDSVLRDSNAAAAGSRGCSE